MSRRVLAGLLALATLAAACRGGSSSTTTGSAAPAASSAAPSLPALTNASPVATPVRLEGAFTVTYTVISATNASGVQVGDTFQRRLVFTPDCPNGPCETGKVTASSGTESYTSHYSWTGAAYSFTSGRTPSCVISGHEVTYRKFQQIYSIIPMAGPSGALAGFAGLYNAQAYAPNSYQGQSCPTPLSIEERLVGIPAGS